MTIASWTQINEFPFFAKDYTISKTSHVRNFVLNLFVLHDTFVKFRGFIANGKVKNIRMSKYTLNSTRNYGFIPNVLRGYAEK